MELFFFAVGVSKKRKFRHGGLEIRGGAAAIAAGRPTARVPCQVAVHGAKGRRWALRGLFAKTRSSIRAKGRRSEVHFAFRFMRARSNFLFRGVKATGMPQGGAWAVRAVRPGQAFPRGGGAALVELVCSRV